MRSAFLVVAWALPTVALADVMPGCGGGRPEVGWEDSDACPDPPCDSDADPASASVAPIGLGGLLVGCGLLVGARRSRGSSAG